MPSYLLTGKVAKARIQPLLPSDWEEKDTGVDFLWENTPRRATQPWRDGVGCYSHLPNGQILDSKWVLGRLLGQVSDSSGNNEDLAVLETHCFRGISGFKAFSERVQLPSTSTFDPTVLSFRDMLHNFDTQAPNVLKTPPPNWWVVKDANANGAGGIAVVTSSVQPRMLNEDHDYVAQRYTWPPVLYGGRKAHVRVYGLMTSDGRAFVHHECFLHVANEPFANKSMEDSVHITNCCANSHDLAKFAGEICADLRSAVCSIKNSQTVIGLADYRASIEASVKTVAENAFQFMRGGVNNGGFEYLGLDFILSIDKDGRPQAYLLEINAPPSQDSATGLPHAEDVHNTVMRDLLSLWVFPTVLGVAEDPGGWRCVYKDVESSLPHDILPSKAAILNRIRWTLYERKCVAIEQKKAEQSMQQACKETQSDHSDDAFAHYSRSFFSYFCPDTRSCQPSGPNRVFFENAGGTQVPRSVVDRMMQSLSVRHRERIGSQSVAAAKAAAARILGAENEYTMFLGQNATNLLYLLSLQLDVQTGDEIILDIDNHMANVKPWLNVASAVNATVTWWDSSQTALDQLVSERTKLVAVTHVSNVTGRSKNLKELRCGSGVAYLVVDGVAAVPHLRASLDGSGVDFYVLSSHKVFGPHGGILSGRIKHVERLKMRFGAMEAGTVNYEACEGLIGIEHYYSCLSEYKTCDEMSADVLPKSSSHMIEAYGHIDRTEAALIRKMMRGLERTKRLRFIDVEKGQKLPMISFVHEAISSREIVDHCFSHGIIIRSGTFLSNRNFLAKHNIPSDGVVRISLTHYNTEEEIVRALDCLEMLPNWF